MIDRIDGDTMRGRWVFCAFAAMLASSIAVQAEPAAAPKDPAHAIANKFSQAAPPGAKIDRPSLDYEMEMLKRARAEDLERGKAKPTSESAASPAPAKTEPPPVTPPPAAAAPAPSPPQTEAKVADPPAPSAAPNVTATTTSTTDTSPRATVLLVLDPSHSENKPQAPPPDLIICLGDACYASQGLDTPSKQIPRAQAVKIKSTADVGATACKDMSGCIFRDVGVPAGSKLEVVDIAVRAATKHEVDDAKADDTCHNDDGELVCDQPVSAIDHRIWIVPEATAKSAGVAAMEEAVAFGLLQDDIALDTDK
jgi:hypothetical protein